MAISGQVRGRLWAESHGRRQTNDRRAIAREDARARQIRGILLTKRNQQCRRRCDNGRNTRVVVTLVEAEICDAVLGTLNRGYHRVELGIEMTLLLIIKVAQLLARQ